MKYKYSPFDRLYVIWDSKNNFYWEKNIPYGYNYQNQAVFESRFVDSLIGATALPYEMIAEVMNRFKEPFIIGGRFRADIDSLQIMRCPEIISEEDVELLSREPAPLKIIVPVKIEEDEQDS